MQHCHLNHQDFTLAAVDAGHRFSQNADHVVGDLRARFDAIRLAEYKGLDSRWHEWSAVETATSDLAAEILDHILV